MTDHRGGGSSPSPLSKENVWVKVVRGTRRHREGQRLKLSRTRALRAIQEGWASLERQSPPETVTASYESR